MARGWLVDDFFAGTPDPVPPPAVTILTIEASIHPSGICAMLIPHADSEKEMTTQQSLDVMLRHQLMIFAAVQAVEWGTDTESGPVGTQQAVAWKQIFVKLSHRKPRRIFKRGTPGGKADAT
jgi:hypothetical protein